MEIIKDKTFGGERPLFGIADMLWNRRAFSSFHNWHDGIQRLYPFAAKSMLQFCGHNTDTHKEPEAMGGFYREESECFMAAWKLDGRAALVRECEANAAAAEELDPPPAYVFVRWPERIAAEVVK